MSESESKVLSSNNDYDTIRLDNNIFFAGLNSSSNQQINSG